MEDEVVIASSTSSSSEKEKNAKEESFATVGCWNLRTGAEHFRHKSCRSTPHGLASIGCRFLAFSEDKSKSGSIFYWSWNKPQVEVRSFPAEPILPLVLNSEGTYIAGGGKSGNIYFWEVATGKLLKNWHGHTREITCLVFNDDESLLISGAEDGQIRVWSLFLMFDDARRENAPHLFEHIFKEHYKKVTAIKTGYGGCKAILVSASEDQTCKVFSLSRGELLGNIVFPSAITAISLDPGERFFYAGGKDGKIYQIALNAPNYNLQIIGALSELSEPVTCLASSADGTLLVSGSQDGMIRVCDAKTRNITRVLRLSKGPVSNVLVIRPQQHMNPGTSVNSLAAPLRRHDSGLPPPLQKFPNWSDDDVYDRVFICPLTYSSQQYGSAYISVQTMKTQIKELQQNGSSAATQMDVERLKGELQKCVQMIQQRDKMYKNLCDLFVSEHLDGNHTENANRPNL